MKLEEKIEFVKTQKGNWNKKQTVGADNKLFKITGIGPKAFKILWFGPTPGMKQGVWNQCWWNYKDIINDPNEIAIEVINKMYKELKKGGQTTL